MQLLLAETDGYRLNWCTLRCTLASFDFLVSFDFLSCDSWFIYLGCSRVIWYRAVFLCEYIVAYYHGKLQKFTNIQYLFFVMIRHGIRIENRCSLLIDQHCVYSFIYFSFSKRCIIKLSLCLEKFFTAFI